VISARFFGLLLLLLTVGRGQAAEKFGHRAYPEAPAADLIDVGRYRDTGRMVQLRSSAATAFLKMVEAARADGVGIVPISGFRPVNYQKKLFDRAVKRYGSERKAARWVAPHGHSEHATGWTLDIGDLNTRSADVDQKFQSTPASRWLLLHAGRFGYELSFPPNNTQGVNHEPWHWRFIGNEQARAAFHPLSTKKR
jgi:D-alanyl-D-alanine carboxypeptidase